MNDNRIRAAARKALMTADPLYYAWLPEQQERFRATMDDVANDKVAAVLLRELLDISCTADNPGDIWSDLPLSQLEHINWAKLLATGIGEDMIWLNESMAENVSLLDFDTLHDYDLNDYHFQEAANSKEITDYQQRDYYALRFSLWARLLINDKLHYATLSSLATYITDQLQEQGDDMIQRLLPHEYVEGKNHGKQEKSSFLWDMQVDAGGLEPQLEELKRQWYQYIQQRWTELSESFKDQPPAAFMKDTSEHGEANTLFLFNNSAALERIRWRSFLSDCRQLERNFSGVECHVTEVWKQTEDWLHETHRDIIQNFDPTVIRLRKTRKVVVVPGAFDSLLQLDEDNHRQ